MNLRKTVLASLTAVIGFSGGLATEALASSSSRS
jgi:hypothetical protein